MSLRISPGASGFLVKRTPIKGHRNGVIALVPPYFIMGVTGPRFSNWTNVLLIVTKIKIEAFLQVTSIFLDVK